MGGIPKALLAEMKPTFLNFANHKWWSNHKWGFCSQTPIWNLDFWNWSFCQKFLRTQQLVCKCLLLPALQIITTVTYSWLLQKLSWNFHSPFWTMSDLDLNSLKSSLWNSSSRERVYGGQDVGHILPFRINFTETLARV
jgi:hypothetical protein